MAECRCGVCEHCTDSVARLVAQTKAAAAPERPRRLLTKTELATLEGDLDVWSRSQQRKILDAYETAVRLLEECVRDVRDVGPTQSTGPRRMTPRDVAWLALRKAEK